mmetsp:Transcript_12515/g.34492  ORF Transcript_12515/g.34492 Transcript_12515/m.34492 type:complete len:181 (-) Transcript_12515:819-1361(-)
MGSIMSRYTTLLAGSLCGGSTRKLIAGWWYSILAMTAALMVMSFAVMGSRGNSELFLSIWSALLLMALSIGGTMIMRKYHNSMAVGFFMGGVVAMSQLFFFLALLYFGHSKDHTMFGESPKEEIAMALLSLLQCFLLGSFAAILGAHRSEIMDSSLTPGMDRAMSTDQSESYEPPFQRRP